MEISDNHITEAVDKLFEALEALQAETRCLLKSLQTGAIAVTPNDLKPSASNLGQLLPAFTAFYYEVGQDPKATIKYPGAIGCSKETILQAKSVNSAKIRFAEAYAALSSLNPSKSRQRFLEKRVPAAFSEVRKPIRFSSLGRICQKQTSRTIPTAVKMPRLISWHWVKLPVAMSIIEPQAALEELESMNKSLGSAAIEAQIRVCKSLSQKDSLRKIQVMSGAVLRVTQAWGTTVEDRHTSLASMPILFEWNGCRSELPTFKFLNSEPTELSGNKKGRKYKQATPILPSLRVYNTR